MLDVLLADPRVDPQLGWMRSESPLVTASRTGNLPIVERLLADPRATKSVQTAFCAAAKSGHLAVLELLLTDPRADPGYFYQDVVRAAAEHGHLAVLERLLADPRTDPSAGAGSPTG